MGGGEIDPNQKNGHGMEKNVAKCVPEKVLVSAFMFPKILLAAARKAQQRITVLFDTKQTPSPPKISNHIFIDIDASFVSIYYLRALPIESVRIELGRPYCNGACIRVCLCVFSVGYKDIPIDCDQHENEIIICCPKIISFLPFSMPRPFALCCCKREQKN